jgi:hypothetical protein
MRSRVWVFVVLFAVAAAAGYGVYSWLWAGDEPPLEPAPAFRDDQTPLPPSDEFEHLAKTDPIAMYEKCLARYQREVKGGLHATLEKTEWVQGHLHPTEVVRIDTRDEFAERPRVRMIWERGYRKDPLLGFEIQGVLLAEEKTAKGEHVYDIQTYRKDAFVKTKAIGVVDDKAKGASRYCLRDAGVYRGMLRTYESWKSYRAKGELQSQFVERKVLEKAGKYPDGQPVECLVVRRSATHPELDAFEIGGHPDARPDVIERDGFTEVTVMIDVKRWLQVGTVIRRTNVNPPRLIGEYYFRDIELNPQFPTDTFTIEGMKAAVK